MEWDEVEEEARHNWDPAKMGLWKRYKGTVHFANSTPHIMLCADLAPKNVVVVQNSVEKWNLRRPSRRGKEQS